MIGMIRGVNKTEKNQQTNPNQPKPIILVRFSKIKKVDSIWKSQKHILSVWFYILLSPKQ